MSWFGSIIDGVGSAVSWVKDNSGTINGALGVVGQVAGLLGASDGTKRDSVEDETDFIRLFKDASTYLEKLAAAMAAAKAPEPSNPEGSQTNTENISGVWTMPVSVDLTGHPAPEMYQDIAKFLRQSDFPTTLTDKNGDIIDVADSIGQAIFANNVVSPPPTLLADVRGDPPSFISTLGFSIPSGDNSCIISGGHSYYALPLGKSATENAWHGALNVQVTTTESFRLKHKEKMRGLRFVSRPQVSAADVWLVTCRLAWATVPLAIAAYPVLKDLFLKEYGTYVTIYNTIDGNIQTVKIQAPPNITPAQVCAALNRSVNDCVIQLNQPNSLRGNVSGGSVNGTYQAPVVEVTDSSLQPGTGQS